MNGGVVLCGYKLMDMMADELYENLPRGFSMLLLQPRWNWRTAITRRRL